MSSPTLYELKNKDGKVLGSMITKIFSWFAISRSNNEPAFFSEIGELLISDLFPYLKGEQPDAEIPEFSLSDVDKIESVGGHVHSSEFVLCVLAKLKELNKSLQYCHKEKVTAQQKGESGYSLLQDVEETIAFFKKQKLNAKEAITMLKKAFPDSYLSEKEKFDAAVNRGTNFLLENPDQEIVLELNAGRVGNLQWQTAEAKTGYPVSLDFLKAVKGPHDECGATSLGISIERIFREAHNNPDIPYQMFIDPRPDCGIQQIALLPQKQPN